MWRYLRSFLVRLALCLALAAPTSSLCLAQDDPFRHGYALIIGTWAYSDSQWPRLDDINLQIQELSAGFGPHFDDVQLLQNPSFDQLDTTLHSFLRSRGNDANARLFIYYAGHGYTETDLRRNEYRGYITGSDTPFPPSDYNAARLKALSMAAVRAYVSDIPAQQVLFVFDSCFAGTVFTARSPETGMALSIAEIERLAKSPVREFITAGDENEKIPALSPLPQLFLNALRGGADKYHYGIVTGQQIEEYLWAQTRDANIHPRMGKLPGGFYDRGDFVFRVIPAWAPSPGGDLVSFVGSFDFFWGYKLSHTAKVTLDQMAVWLGKNPETKVTINVGGSLGRCSEDEQLTNKSDALTPLERFEKYGSFKKPDDALTPLERILKKPDKEPSPFGKWLDEKKTLPICGVQARAVADYLKNRNVPMSRITITRSEAEALFELWPASKARVVVR